MSFIFIFRLSVLTTGLGDDEYDYWKAEAGNAMKDRMGLADNPLDGVVARVCTPHIVSVFLFSDQIVGDNRLANPCICSNISSRSSPLNSAPWMDRK